MAIKSGQAITNIDTRNDVARIELLKAKPLWSKDDCYFITGISKPTLDRLIKAGKITARKIGKSVRIDNFLT